MNTSLTRESVAQGKALERLLVNGQPAAIVGPMREESAELLMSYYGAQWQWWALIDGVKGGTWLVRNSYRSKDYPLVLEAADHPVVLKSSWDSPSPEKGRIRTKRTRKATA